MVRINNARVRVLAIICIISIITLQSSLLAMLVEALAVLHLVIGLVSCVPTIITQMPLAAVQNQNETYFSYLPYESDCLYNDTNLLPSVKILTALNSDTFYDKIQYQSSIVFWTPVRNGLSIMMILEELDQGYDGFILYNSKIRELSRMIMAYSIDATNLTLYQGTPIIFVQNMTIIFNPVSTFPIEFTPEAYQIFSDCLSVS